MIRRSFSILALIAVIILPANAQVKEEADLKREVTLYNPYKPSLRDVKKRSYLPEINDTAKINPSFRYEVITKPFTPVYPINTIKSASLLSDPLPKLYKGYVKAGLGNNNTPFGEISIASHRSRKGALGLYAKHYSSNGKVPLENRQRVFAGFMDNDAMLFGKKFFRQSLLDVSANFIQRTRYAYGYKTGDIMFEPIKKDVRLNYYDLGASATYSSLNLDSADFSYDFGLSYDFFHNTKDRTMNHIGFSGGMAKLFEGFYVGSGLNFDHYRLSDSLNLKPKYIFSVSPYLKKSTDQWNFKLGLQLAVERNLTSAAKLHLYPDVNFGFTIVPEYMRFFAELGGRLENNDPLNVISENPYLVPDGSIFRIPNTDHSLTFSAGLKGNNGMGGNYVVSASYSLIDDMLLFANIVYPDTVPVVWNGARLERGNHFIAVPDEAEVFNIHGELSGKITDKLSFNAKGNFYKYTLSANQYAWNKPDWDGRIGMNYNLRNKIMAGAELTALGSRKLMSSESPAGWMTLDPIVTTEPFHINLGLSVEYRYTKILSFWVKVNNISYNRYYEWAYYPSQMFNFLVGFSYSL